MSLRQLMAASALLLIACAGEPGDSGFAEPLQIAGAAFKKGALPGQPPSDDAEANELDLTTIETNNTVIHPGQTGKRISGRARDTGYSVAVRFEDRGTGYWVKPLDEADSVYPGELAFRLDIEVAHDLPLGPQRLLFTVIDARGRASRQQAFELCVASPYDKALSACDETQQPPAAMISLTWDSAADLDLVVRTPDGELVDARHPSTLTDPSLTLEPERQGVLYTDDARGCAGRSVRREDLVWTSEIPEGRYDVFVNLFDACGARATFFEVRAWRRTERDDGSYTFRQAGETAVGQLIDEEANGGSGLPRKLASFDLP
ncbi:MAG TPA: hypothetical protein VMF89_28470 [Polyangiales bacterium]|nr:hypothetical protein [Polyangiales bacterium]